MYEHNQSKLYFQLRNLITEEDLFKCISFINRIKEHRYFKIKRRQIGKFKCIVKKSSGCLHNFANSLEGCPIKYKYSSYSKCWFQHPNPQCSTSHNNVYRTSSTQGAHHFSGYNFFHSHQHSSPTNHSSPINQSKWSSTSPTPP